MMRRFVLPALLASCGAFSPAAAQESCADRSTIPAEYAGWEAARPLESAKAAGGLAAAALAPGEARDLALHPDGEVAYLTLPEGAGEPSSFGGMAAFDIAQAGTYRVALGDFAWVDVSREGKVAETVKFGHGPDCTPIRKIVDFPLEPGRYTLEVSGNVAPRLRVMLLRVDS